MNGNPSPSAQTAAQRRFSSAAKPDQRDPPRRGRLLALSRAGLDQLGNDGKLACRRTPQHIEDAGQGSGSAVRWGNSSIDRELKCICDGTEHDHRRIACPASIWAR